MNILQISLAFAIFLTLLSSTTSNEASGTCSLPPIPENGSHNVEGNDANDNTMNRSILSILYSCNEGYMVIGSRLRICISGLWTNSKEVKCARLCKLPTTPGVEYTCRLIGPGQGGFRPCAESEPEGQGIVVEPRCAPSYYSPGPLPNMNCVNGSWDVVATCQPECGLITRPEVLAGTAPERVPWHAGLYVKTSTPYMQICGGSLVSTKAVLTGAHCVWDNVNKGLFPASNYAVALGKVFRPWKLEDDAQRFDIVDIKVPARYYGHETNFQEDIAILRLAKDAIFNVNIRPVCLNFDPKFEQTQLKAGALGKVAGWGLTRADGKPSQVLKVEQQPYVPIKECLTLSPPDFRPYISADKICAGFKNGSALCKGDGGGGLAFPEMDKGTTRYFLRGIVSAAPSNDHLCNVEWLNTYTLVSKHEEFIKDFIYE